MDLSMYTPDYNDKVERDFFNNGISIQVYTDHVNVYCKKDDLQMNITSGICVFNLDVGDVFMKKVVGHEQLFVNIFIECGDEGRWACHFGEIMSYRKIFNGGV